MTNRRPDENQLGVIVVSHKAGYDGRTRRRIYDWLQKEMTSLGIPPTAVTGKGPGLPKSYASFHRLRKRLEVTDFSQLEYLSLKHLKPERDVPGSNWSFFDWTATGGFSREDPLCSDIDLWRAHWTVYHSDTTLADDAIMRSVLAFARITVQRYGYITFGTRRASMYAVGMASESGRGYWLDTYFRNHAYRNILRDVYPYNFLTRPYLDLPIEDTTLEHWIRRDSARGTLASFTDSVTLWRPPVEHIPVLRETLFRAGHVLYYHFFQPRGPYYRDWNKPFVPHAPIPKAFRADTYIGTDPTIAD